MNDVWNWIRGAIATLGGVLGWLLGGVDGFLYTLIAFCVLDYITGVIAAGVEKKLDSNVGFKGIARKIAIFIVVALGHLVDREILGDSAVLRTAAIFFYLSNEGLSILENIARIGLPVPEKLREVLAQLKEDKKHD